MADSDYDSGNEDWAEEETSPTFTFQPDHVVIGIDTHPSMFHSDTIIPIRFCFEALVEYMEDFLLESSGCNLFAILLAGRDEPLIKFNDNLIDSIKLLKSKLGVSDDEMRGEMERQGDLDMADFLLRGKKLFQGTSSNGKKNFLYITNDYGPKVDKFSVFNEMKLFSEENIAFQIIPTCEDFKYESFYNELFYVMKAEPDAEICVDVKGMVQKFSEFLSKREFRSKVNIYPFFNDWEYFIHCTSIPLIKSTTFLNKEFTTKGDPINIQREDAELTYSLTPQGTTDFNNITFSRWEAQDLLDSKLPIGYSLMYISKRSSEACIGIKYPRVVMQNTGLTTDYFKSFWTYCVENDVSLVCVEKLKNPGEIYFAELCPIKLNQQLAFLSIRLPYIDDTTPLPPDLNDDVAMEDDPNLSKKRDMDELVRELTVDFDFSMIPDVEIRKEKAYIKAKLLDEEVKEYKGREFRQEKDLSRLLTMFPALELDESQTKKRAYSRGGASKRGKK